MIIPSILLKLDYTPSTDILAVEWPDIHSYTLNEVKDTLTEILKTIRHYDVKRLLIDARSTVVSVGQEEYAAISSAFGQQLLSTRLEKLARLESSSPTREAQVREITRNNTSPISFKSFASREEAYNWLKEGT